MAAVMMEHRTSCHRCGNLRKSNVHCEACPHTFCARCAERCVIEYGTTIFDGRCPVCTKECCCALPRTATVCNSIAHCYKKCPACKNRGATGSSAAEAVFAGTIKQPQTTLEVAEATIAAVLDRQTRLFGGAGSGARPSKPHAAKAKEREAAHKEKEGSKVRSRRGGVFSGPGVKPAGSPNAAMGASGSAFVFPPSPSAGTTRRGTAVGSGSNSDRTRRTGTRWEGRMSHYADGAIDSTEAAEEVHAWDADDSEPYEDDAGALSESASAAAAIHGGKIRPPHPLVMPAPLAGSGGEGASSTLPLVPPSLEGRRRDAITLLAMSRPGLDPAAAQALAAQSPSGALQMRQRRHLLAAAAAGAASSGKPYTTPSPSGASTAAASAGLRWAQRSGGSLATRLASSGARVALDATDSSRSTPSPLSLAELGGASGASSASGYSLPQHLALSDSDAAAEEEEDEDGLWTAGITLSDYTPRAVRTAWSGPAAQAAGSAAGHPPGGYTGGYIASPRRLHHPLDSPHPAELQRLRAEEEAAGGNGGVEAGLMPPFQRRSGSAVGTSALGPSPLKREARRLADASMASAAAGGAVSAAGSASSSVGSGESLMAPSESVIDLLVSKLGSQRDADTGAFSTARRRSGSDGSDASSQTTCLTLGAAAPPLGDEVGLPVDGAEADGGAWTGPPDAIAEAEAEEEGSMDEDLTGVGTMGLSSSSAAAATAAAPAAAATAAAPAATASAAAGTTTSPVPASADVSTKAEGSEAPCVGAKRRRPPHSLSPTTAAAAAARRRTSPSPPAEGRILQALRVLLRVDSAAADEVEGGTAEQGSKKRPRRGEGSGATIDAPAVFPLLPTSFARSQGGIRLESYLPAVVADVGTVPCDAISGGGDRPGRRVSIRRLGTLKEQEGAGGSSPLAQGGGATPSPMAADDESASPSPRSTVAPLAGLPSVTPLAPGDQANNANESAGQSALPARNIRMGYPTDTEAFVPVQATERIAASPPLLRSPPTPVSSQAASDDNGQPRGSPTETRLPATRPHNGSERTLRPLVSVEAPSTSHGAAALQALSGFPQQFVAGAVHMPVAGLSSLMVPGLNAGIDRRAGLPLPLNLPLDVVASMGLGGMMAHEALSGAPFGPAPLVSIDFRGTEPTAIELAARAMARKVTAATAMPSMEYPGAPVGFATFGGAIQKKVAWALSGEPSAIGSAGAAPARKWTHGPLTLAMKDHDVTTHSASTTTAPAISFEIPMPTSLAAPFPRDTGEDSEPPSSAVPSSGESSPASTFLADARTATAIPSSAGHADLQTPGTVPFGLQDVLVSHVRRSVNGMSMNADDAASNAMASADGIFPNAEGLFAAQRRQIAVHQEAFSISDEAPATSL